MPEPTTDPTPASMGGPLSETDRLAEIQARLDAATPGPWHRKGKAVLGPREDRDLGTGPAALLHTGMPYDGPDGRCGANAELAANAPADLAFLLDLVGVLEGQLATARGLLDQQRGATRVAAAAADRFRDVLSEALGHPDNNPGDDVLVTELRKRFGFSGPEPTRWRDFLTGARAQIDQIEADRSALGLDGGDPDAE